MKRFKYKVARFEKGQEPEILDGESVGIRPDGTLHNLGVCDFELSQEEDDIYFKILLSTGLEDKNNNLMFHKDLVILETVNTDQKLNGRKLKFVIEYDEKNAKYFLEPLDDCESNALAFGYEFFYKDKIEVVGNICSNK